MNTCLIPFWLLQTRAPENANIAWPDTVVLTVDGEKGLYGQRTGEEYDLLLTQEDREKFAEERFFKGARFDTLPSDDRLPDEPRLVLAEIALRSFREE